MAGEMGAQLFAEVQQRLNEKVAAVGDCQACGLSGSVVLASHLVTPVGTALGGSLNLGAANYPQAMLMCTNCGHTRYFNVLLLRGDKSGG